MVAERGLRFPPLKGGLNYRKDKMTVKIDEACFIRNCHIDQNGIASTRRGLRCLNGASPLDGEVESIFQYNKVVDGVMTRIILISAGFGWYVYDETLGTFTKIYTLSSDEKPSLVNFVDGSNNAIVILANGTDFIMWDGTTVSNVTGAFPSTSMPRYLIVYANRLAASGCDDDPTVVFMSDLKDATTWGASNYFMFENDSDRERITGLGTTFNFMTVHKANSVHIVTEGDVTSDTVQQVMVSKGWGTSSHWGIVTVGSNIFFNDNSGFYRGRLREAVENGMIVTSIGDNISYRYEDVRDVSKCVAIYDGEHDEIVWGLKPNLSENADLGMVLSLGNSVFDSSTEGDRPVWGSFFDGDGFRCKTFGVVVDSNGKRNFWVGDEDGFIYTYGEKTQFDDNGSKIIVELELAPVYPGGFSVRKNFTHWCPLLFQNYNESVNVDYVVDGSYRTPATPVVMEAIGNIPYWNEGTDSHRLQGWGTTVWSDRPMLPIIVDVRVTGYFINIWMKCAGENASDDIAYGGGELFYRILGKRR